MDLAIVAGLVEGSDYVEEYYCHRYKVVKSAQNYFNKPEVHCTTLQIICYCLILLLYYLTIGEDIVGLVVVSAVSSGVSRIFVSSISWVESIVEIFPISFL